MFKFVTSPLWWLIESPGHILGTNVDMHTFVQYLDKTATDECISSDFLLKNSSPSSPPVNENDKAMSKLTPSVLWSPPPKAYYNLLLYFAWLPLTVKNAYSLVSTSPKKTLKKPCRLFFNPFQHLGRPICLLFAKLLLFPQTNFHSSQFRMTSFYFVLSIRHWLCNLYMIRA